MEKREEIKKIIMKKTRMGKIVVALAMLVCFSAFLTLASASIYEDFEQLETRGCNITDYGKVSFSTANLRGKFGLVSGYSSCTFILDYAPFELDMVNLYDYSFYYGEIKQSTIRDNDYIILLGESESALEEVVNLVAGYENHELLLRGEYALFYNDNYFGLYGQGKEFTLPPNSNCTDDPDANMYNSNRVTVGLGENITSFDSYCISNNYLSFPYCDNDEFSSIVYNCKCVEDRCIATLSEVFYWLAQFEAYEVTQDFVYDAIGSWINNPDISYVPSTPVSAPPPPPGGEESAGTATTTTFTETTAVSEEQFDRGYTRRLAEAERFVVEVEGESHYVGVVEVGETTATIEVGSEPQQVTLSIGEARKFEVTNDSYYDIYVQLNSIENDKASLTIKGIYEEIPAEEREEPAKEGSKLWVWLILALAVVAVIAYLFCKKKR